MTAMQPTPNVILVDIDDCAVDIGNIRPAHRIPKERIFQLAASIKRTQQSGGGFFGTGVERPICVYRNGTDELVVPEGQERLLAMRYLVGNDPAYNYIGIPATVHEAPRDIWASTVFQTNHHDADPVDPLSLVERAVELKNTALPDGTPATWKTVADVMGGDPSVWSHNQHILKLTDALKEAVAQGEIRPQNAAIIGRDLPEKDLQTRFHKELMADRKNKPKLEATIQKIRKLVALEPVIQADTEDIYEVSEDDDGDEVLSPPAPIAEIDREAAFLLNYHVFKALTRLEILGGEGRLSGTRDEIAQIIERFKDLQNYAD